MTISRDARAANLTTDASRRDSAWAMVVVLLAAIGFAYWPGLEGGYVFDDFPNIVDNTTLHVSSLAWQEWVAAAFSSPSSDLQRPLAMLTFAANHYFSGLDPVPMKLTNIGIHALNACLVFGLVRLLLRMAAPASDPARREWAARFAAAAWAMHPINLMAVLFVVQRMESLSHTFVFSGLWLYLAGRQRQLVGDNGWPLVFSGLVLATAVGTLAKESAVLLPLYAFLVEACVLSFRGPGGERQRWLQASFWPVLWIPAAIGVAWLLPKALVPGAFDGRPFDLGDRLLTEARVVIDYLRWTLLPSLRELSLYHDDYPVSRGLWAPPATAFAWMGVVALAAAATWLRRRRPLASLGIAWFLAAHLLTATFLPLELVYEHRNYFASLGIVISLADVLLLAPATAGARRIGALLAGLVLVAFTLTTHLRAREWSDPYRFASTEAAKHPQSPRATYALGRVLVTMTDYDPASPLVQPAFDALERARLAPGSGVLAHSGLLLLAAHTGRRGEEAWWDEMLLRLRTDPIGPQEVNAIGALTRYARRDTRGLPPQRMLDMYGASLSKDTHPEVLALYGDFALNVMGDGELALRLWTAAAQAAPREPRYREHLVKLLVHQHRWDAAAAEIEQLRHMGRLGQHDALAATLEQRLRAARATTSPAGNRP